MPKSTIAVSFVAIFLLGYVLGSGRAGSSASAGPTAIEFPHRDLVTSNPDGDALTIWSFGNGRVTEAVRYTRGLGSSDGVENLVVRRFIPDPIPARPEPAKETDETPPR